MNRSSLRPISLALGALLLLGACSSNASPAPATAAPATAAPATAAPATAAPATAAPATAAPATAAPAAAVAVRVAMTPFYDYQFFSVARELGWDKELGLDLQFTWLTQSGPSVEALANGSVDTVNTCVICNFPYYESVPELTDFVTTNQYRGFVLIGRKGAAKTYDEFNKELGDANAAVKATLEQVRGKTFPMYAANYETLLKATIGQNNMTLDDVKVVNFPDDQKAALAFIGGTGDFYMGGLPSEVSILQGREDEFQIIGGSDLLGPAGLWHSQVGSTADWLTKNEDAALKITAMSYRYNRYVNEKPDVVLPIVAKAMTEHSGTALTVADLQYVFDTFETFRSYQEDIKTTYEPTSPLYWGNSADFYVKLSSDLPAGADYRRTEPLDAWFAKFLGRADLLAWVDAPLK
jgi:ABC-type nitrate/sulfonate/bicarbonate transport system substrate-binding protein